MKQPLTVSQLYNLLSRVPVEHRHLPVFTEGCDCWGDAAAIVVRPHEEEPYALIIRGTDADSGSEHGTPDGIQALEEARRLREEGY